MTWSFSVSGGQPTLTQSGTDTDLSGIATAISGVATVARLTAYTTAQLVKPPVLTGFWYKCTTAGTTTAVAPAYGTVDGGTTTDGTAVFTAFKAPDVQSLGNSNYYYMPAVDVIINGTLTNANPQLSTFLCYRLFLPSASSNFTSGTWASDGVTPLYDGVHFATVYNSGNAAVSSFSISASGAQCTLIGGEVQLSDAVNLSAGSIPKSYYTNWRGTSVWSGTTSTRFRAYSTSAIFRSVVFYNMAYDLFQVPAEFSAQARKSEYISQYVGAQGGGVDAYFKASALNNIDGTYDFDNWGSGYVELFNCAKGANLNVTSQQAATGVLQRHCVPLYQDIRITAKNTAGSVVQDVRFSSTDSPTNSPTITITTSGSLKTWDFRSPLTYQTTTNSSGIALSSPILKVWYYQSGLQQNLRFPSSTATYEGRAYNYKTLNVSIVLGSSTIQDLSAGVLALDTATTVTESVAGAITGITLTPSGSTGGVVTISSNHTTQDIWNYYRYWISQFANRSSNDTWSCIAGTIDLGSWTLVVNSGVALTTTTAITKITSSTVTTGAAINSISITGNLNQATPTNLTSLNLTGNLTFNTNTDTTITLTNCTITGTISNSGTGIVTITNSGSTLGTIGANVTTRLSAVFTANSLLTGSTVAVFDSTGVQIDVTTNSGTSYTYDATGGTGTWSWVVEYYGKQRQTGTFTPSTGATTVTASYTTDIYITQTTKATVAAYTDLTNDDMVYDYAAYQRAQVPKYVFVTRSGTDVDWGSTNVAYNSTAGSVWAYTYVDNSLFVGGVLQASGVLGATDLLNGTPLLTIKSTAMADGAYFKRQKTTGTMTFTGTTINTLYQNNIGPNTRFYFTGVQANSSVLLVDDTAVERLFVQNTSAYSYTYYIEPGASGTWIAKIRNYLNNPTDVTFTPPGGDYFIGSDNIPDTYVVDTYVNTAAYTDLETSQKVYDYFKYFSTTHTGIYFGQLFNKGFGTLTANEGWTLDPAAVAMMAMATDVTTHTTGFNEAVTLVVTGDFTQGTATLSNDVKVRANNLDSEILFSGVDSATIYATSTDALTNTSPGASSTTGIIRFKYGAALSGVTMSGTVYVRMVIGGAIQVQTLALVSGTNTLNLSTTTLLQSVIAKVDNVPTAVLAANVESTYSVGDSLRLANSVLGGKTSGAQSGVETFRDLGDTKDRLVSTVDTKGNRSIEEYNLS